MARVRHADRKSVGWWVSMLQQAKAAHLIFDKSSQGQIVEQVGEEPPDISIPIFPQTFVIESVYLSDLPWFVVTSQDGDAITESQFHGYQQSNCFDRVVAPIDVVAHEEVVCIGGVASDSKEFCEIMLSKGWVTAHDLRLNLGEERTNWPWMSPHTVTGQRTCWTLDSSINISRVYKH